MKKIKKQGSMVASIGTAVPQYCYSQQSIADFMIRYFGIPEEQSRKLSAIYHRSGIDYRHSVLPDFVQNGHAPLLFDASSPNPLLSKRLAVYEPHAVTLASSAVKDCLNGLKKSMQKRLLPITHLVTVSCTGMSAPGLDIALMKSLQLPDDVERTSINFMGCYAGFHALKMADAICRSNEKATVLLVMVELCSLHFQPDLDNENLVVNSLFADGAAALIVTSPEKLKETGEPVVKLSGFHAKVIHSGEEMMTWHPSEKGFLMGLDALVPQLIEEHAGPLIGEVLDRFKMKKEKVSHWAIHPGGKKILQALERAVGITENDLQESYGVLKNFGNMSSVTVSFVLKSILQQKTRWKKKERILAAGFGPGITIETALLQPALA
jgi:predicted naringenin-chalcone synthase